MFCFRRSILPSFMFIFLSNLKPSHTDTPIRVVLNHNDIPKVPSPVLLQITLSEFGDRVGGHASPTINTPASTTAELGHPSASPLLQANTKLPSETTLDQASDENFFPGFQFINTNDIDNSPPARSPSPGLPCVVSPVNLATCFCNPPDGAMGMGIRCWSCNVYNSVVIPASSSSCKVSLLFFHLPTCHSFCLLKI